MEHVPHGAGRGLLNQAWARTGKRLQLPSCHMTAAFQPSSWAYLFRSVHAVPGFVFQEILFSKVTFATFGTLKWLLSSVFPWGMQIQNPITACQQHLHRQAQEVTG